ncbi:MAG: XRE family transcriptional regulator [Planctomycetota bacterium]|nr:MAG: XRE family transcriptional regulator [Planctomycetota bacterium]
METLLERELRDPEFSRLFAQEELILAATELVAETMCNNQINKAELARRVGTSKSNVTQLLAGTRNMTLRTLADLMFVMGKRVRLSARDAGWMRKGDEQSLPSLTLRMPEEPSVKWCNEDLTTGPAGQAA